MDLLSLVPRLPDPFNNHIVSVCNIESCMGIGPGNEARSSCTSCMWLAQNAVHVLNRNIYNYCTFPQ